MWWWFLAVFIPLCRSLVSCYYSYTLPTPQVLPMFKVWICLPNVFLSVFSTCSLGLPWCLSDSLSAHCCLLANACQLAWGWGWVLSSHWDSVKQALCPQVLGWEFMRGLPSTSSPSSSGPETYSCLSRRIRFGFYSVVFPELLLDLPAP